MWRSKLLEQRMPGSYTKKLAVIGNASASMTDSKKDLKEPFLDQKLEAMKCITYNIKPNKGIEKVLALIGS